MGKENYLMKYAARFMISWFRMAMIKYIKIYTDGSFTHMH